MRQTGDAENNRVCKLDLLGLAEFICYLCSLLLQTCNTYANLGSKISRQIGRKLGLERRLQVLKACGSHTPEYAGSCVCVPFDGVRADHCLLDKALLAATDAAAACIGAVPTGVGGTNGSWLGPTLGLTFSCSSTRRAVCLCIAAAVCCTSICRYATAN